MAKTAEKARKRSKVKDSDVGKSGKKSVKDARVATGMKPGMKPGMKADAKRGAAVDSRYTDPRLRQRLKEKIQAGDKGGKKGQWSARKSQLLVKRYEKAGGGYVDSSDGPGSSKRTGAQKGAKGGRSKGKDERQKSLETWTSQKWQTKDGDTRARRGGVTKRYLPKKAWDELSDNEKQATDEVKEGASKAGQQFVPNAPAAMAAGRRARGASSSSSDGGTGGTGGTGSTGGAAGGSAGTPRAARRRRQPVAGYDEMTIRDILAAASQAPPRSLRAMLTYEKANRDRKTLVPQLERRLAERS